MNGKFISIEGTEGAGKTTQIRFIADYLRQQGITVLLTREPGGTELGEEIRELLLAPREAGMHEDTELLLMFAARAEHVARIIKPALARGEWVISDRFVDATFAYQGGGRGISQQRIQKIADWTLQGMAPDLTLLFDIPVQAGLERIQQRPGKNDRFEQEKTAFFERIREVYLQRTAQEPQRLRRIDASQTVDAIRGDITEILNTFL